MTSQPLIGPVLPVIQGEGVDVTRCGKKQKSDTSYYSKQSTVICLKTCLKEILIGVNML